MSSSTQNKANMMLEKKTTNVVNKVDAASKKVNASTKKPVAKKAPPKKSAVKKVEAQKHIADQMGAFLSTRVWPD